jgi:dTDP-4-dehydrorhamnose 3,5-epimerase-like enzyme
MMTKINSQDISFHEAIKRLHNDEIIIKRPPFRKGNNRQSVFELIKETLFIPFFQFDKAKNVRSCSSYRRAATAWHYHNIDENLMCQVSGVKKVALFTLTYPAQKYVSEF